jgi:hypothetical protein
MRKVTLRIRKVHYPPKGVMIRANCELDALEVGSEVCDRPHNSKTLLFCGRVVLFGRVKGAGPVTQRKGLTIWLELQEAAAWLALRGVRIQPHLSLRGIGPN